MAAIKADERYMILEEEKPGELIITTDGDVMENTIYLIDGNRYRLIRNGVSTLLLLEKNEENVLKKAHIEHEQIIHEKSDVKIIGKILESTSLTDLPFNCAVCQQTCINCKFICVTCKTPCHSCNGRTSLNSSTDTDDFEKYLESLSKKIKPPSKVKTVGVDTCDLETHFDYYKEQKKVNIIKKSVATDCGDLNLRKPSNKKYNLKTVGVDTSDLGGSVVEDKADDSDCEFFWNGNDEPRTYSKKNNVEKEMKAEIEDENDRLSDCSYNADDVEINEALKEEMELEEVHEINLDGSTSDESDLDLVTAGKVSRSKKVAKAHKLTLNEIKVQDGRTFECSICNEAFNKKYLGILHLENHVEGCEYKCVKCFGKFSTVNLLMEHMEEHGKSDESQIGISDKIVNNHEKNIKCSICDKKFDSKSKMLSHKRFHKRKDKSFQCSLCVDANESPNTFMSYKALYVHKRLKHGIKDSQNEEDIKKERKPRLKREFVCLFCGKEFKSNKALSDHAPVHTGEKNYRCDICNKSYTTNANLQIHKRTHTGQKNFKCTVCDKAFHKKDSLKVHFRKHSGERPFQCDLCPMTFDRNYILKNHRLRHFSEKTYICPVCGKAFTTHGGLNNHEKSHKKDPDVKKPRKPAVKPTLETENAVICDVCGKVYSTRSNLRIHKFVHLGVKPFQCPVCQQSYAKKDSMLTHMRKHTDERPFACETCGMTFYRNHTLKTHRLRHTGERPHKCPLCGKCFTQSSSLAYHIKHHDRREEKKKINMEDSVKAPKKKRVTSPQQKKTGKSPIKQSEIEMKKSEIRTEIIIMDKDSNPIHVNEKDNCLPKGGHFMLPVVDKEFLLLDRNLALDPEKNSSEFFAMDKDPSQNKFSYYIAKSHVFSMPKDNPKTKNYLSVIKNDQDYENLIVSKNSFITKDGNLITNKPKEGYVDENEQRLEKSQNVLPVTGEILNATFISDENGELIPYTSMALQTINADNVVINPLIPLESDDPEKRKVVIRTPKLGSDKLKCNSIGSKIGNDKGKGSGVILKESRSAQKIQVVSPGLTPIQIQVPCNTIVDEGMLHGIHGSYYNNVQSNQL